MCPPTIPGAGPRRSCWWRTRLQVRELVAQVLQASGYTVLAAADPAAALTLSDRHPGPIHLLLTDVVMPEMSGRELCQRLKSLRPRTRVLYMSGYTDEALGRHGVLEPGTFLLQKPFRVGALGQKVREVLDAPEYGRPAARWSF